MDFRLKIFSTAAELQSFSKAGEVLYLSQPAVSFQIRSLEEEVGAKLFHRDRNRVILTEAGEALLTHAREIFKIYDKAEQEIKDITNANSIKGHLVIGATSVIGRCYLPTAIEGFKRNYPDIKVVVQISNTSALLKAMFQGTLDLCIVSEPFSLYGDSFLYHPYIRAKLVLAVPSNHRWANGGGAVSLDELLEEPFIIREEGSGTRATIERYLQEKGKKIEDLNVIMTLGSTEAVRSAVESGVGVAILSKCSIQAEVQRDTIRTVKIRNIEMFQNFTLVFSKKFRRISSEMFLHFIVPQQQTSEGTSRTCPRKTAAHTRSR